MSKTVRANRVELHLKQFYALCNTISDLLLDEHGHVYSCTIKIPQSKRLYTFYPYEKYFFLSYNIAKKELNRAQEEVDFYKRYPERNSSVCFVMKK